MANESLQHDKPLPDGACFRTRSYLCGLQLNSGVIQHIGLSNMYAIAV
jgi:hypothetical protein